MMKTSLSFSKILIIAVVLGGVGVAVWQLTVEPKVASAPQVAGITVPTFSSQAVAGKALFDSNCARCHGENGAGSDQGPPFLHEIYNPGHHSDRAFLSAVRNGVRRHHWRFGDMPAQPQVSDVQVMDIVRYVRELQKANGIVYKPHQM